MSDYFDTSAMIRAYRLGIVPKGVTRPHALAEFYGTLTGRGLATVQDGRTILVNHSPADAAEAARSTFAGMTFRGLTGAEGMAALKAAAELNISGRAIHDWLHIEAARLARARCLVTSNVSEWQRMTQAKVVSADAHFADW